MDVQKKRYPELPYNWTVARQGGEIADYFYAYNTQTGEKGPLRWTYGDALRDAEKREPGRRV